MGRHDLSLTKDTMGFYLSPDTFAGGGKKSLEYTEQNIGRNLGGAEERNGLWVDHIFVLINTGNGHLLPSYCEMKN